MAELAPHSCSSQLTAISSDTVRINMKDVTTTRHSRNSLVYPKKRPSPHGISKSHRSPLLPANGLARRTPRSTKVALIQQKQREAQIQALRREGIFLEEEYREEIRYYMLDMEVCCHVAYCLIHYSSDIITAFYHVVDAIHGPATRNSMAYATMPRRLLGRNPFYIPPSS